MPDGDWRFVAAFIAVVEWLGIEDWVTMDNGDKLFKVFGLLALAALVALLGDCAFGHPGPDHRGGNP